MFDFPFSKEFERRKIKRSFDLEPQEILLDKLSKKKAEELGVSERKLEVPLSRHILQMGYVFSLILIGILFAKAFQLQVMENEKYTALAERNQFIIYKIKASRGVIYDSALNQLVFNRPSFDLVCNKNYLPEKEEERLRVLKEVAEILESDLSTLNLKIEESREPKILIAENLSHQTLLILETKIRELPGFEVDRTLIRDYESGEIYAHLIGYTGKITASEFQESSEIYSITDYVGREGLEKSYEEILRKNPGKLQIERDALGNIVSQKIIQFPEPGKNLVLFLDSDLQKKITEELEKTLKKIGSKKATAIALDPKTGGVLALVSLPSFDNNLFQKGADPEALKKLLEDPLELEPLFNRAISGRYLTGSTIKPLIASAVLEEKIISPTKKINCQGLITIPHLYDPEKETKKYDWTVHGWTDMKKAIAESCNVYFYTVGGGYEEQEGLGPTKIKEYLELFGWGDKTYIDLPGEASGFLPDKEWKQKTWHEGWWDGDTYNFSIGQGYLLITPLEVANGFAAIANGGTLFQPQVVKEIVDSEKNIIKEFKTKIIRQNFIETEYLQIVREGMRQAVTGVGSPRASAVLLNSLPVSSAAKTGTAELGNDIYHNWVTVFAPYEDPEIVLTVMIERVKEEHVAALPVAQQVLQWYFSR